MYIIRISKRLYRDTNEIENALSFHLNYAIQDVFFACLFISGICEKKIVDSVGKRQKVLENMFIKMNHDKLFWKEIKTTKKLLF